jgi:hypothetical protein
MALTKPERDAFEESLTAYFAPYQLSDIDEDLIASYDPFYGAPMAAMIVFAEMVQSWWNTKMAWVVGVFATASSVGDAISAILGEADKEPEDGGIGGPPPGGGGNG